VLGRDLPVSHAEAIRDALSDPRVFRDILIQVVEPERHDQKRSPSRPSPNARAIHAGIVVNESFDLCRMVSLELACGGARIMEVLGDTMKRIENINVLFIAGFGPIVREATASRKLYNQVLGIRFKEEKDGYLHTEALKGANSFALWPLSQ